MPVKLSCSLRWITGHVSGQTQTIEKNIYNSCPWRNMWNVDYVSQKELLKEVHSLNDIKKASYIDFVICVNKYHLSNYEFLVENSSCYQDGIVPDWNVHLRNLYNHPFFVFFPAW